MTTHFDSAQIYLWPRSLLAKCTDGERPSYKLSPLNVKRDIVAILGSDPFNMNNVWNENIFVEVDKETNQEIIEK